MTETAPYADSAAPQPSKRAPLVQLGGWLGLAAACAGLAIFLLGCAGFDGGFRFHWVPSLLAAAGMVSTVLGGVLRHGGVEDTPVLAGLFLNLFGLVGGLLEWALWRGWDIFYRQVNL